MVQFIVWGNDFVYREPRGYGFTGTIRWGWFEAGRAVLFDLPSALQDTVSR